MAKPSEPKSKNIFAVVGSDEGAVKTAARELADRLTPPDAGEFGVEVIDGAADNAGIGATRVHEAVAALRTLPFFGGKLVWSRTRTSSPTAPSAVPTACSKPSSSSRIAEGRARAGHPFLAQRHGDRQAAHVLQEPRQAGGHAGFRPAGLQPQRLGGRGRRARGGTRPRPRPGPHRRGQRAFHPADRRRHPPDRERTRKDRPLPRPRRPAARWTPRPCARWCRCRARG